MTARVAERWATTAQHGAVQRRIRRRDGKRRRRHDGHAVEARQSLTGSSRARGIASALANLRHALEREACVGPELQLERNLTELPQRVLVGTTRA